MDLIYYFPLEDCYTQEKLETLVMQNLGVKKVHYGLGELFLYCSQFIQNNLQSTMFKTFDLIEPSNFVNFPKFSAPLQVQIIWSLTSFDSFQQDFFVDWLVTFF